MTLEPLISSPRASHSRPLVSGELSILSLHRLVSLSIHSLDSEEREDEECLLGARLDHGACDLIENLRLGFEVAGVSSSGLQM